MREAAESAETDQFDPQISAASGAAADALQVGKIKNKVLKLTGEVQVLNIKVRAFFDFCFEGGTLTDFQQIAQAKAKGSDTSDLESQLNDEQTKLNTDVSTDKSNAGKASQGVVASSSAATSSAAVSSTSTQATSTKTSSVAASTATATANDDAVTQTAANFKELE